MSLDSGTLKFITFTKYMTNNFVFLSEKVSHLLTALRKSTPFSDSIDVNFTAVSVYIKEICPKRKQTFKTACQ